MRPTVIDFNFILKTHKQFHEINIDEDLSVEHIYEKFKLLLEGDSSKYSAYIELRDSFLIQYYLSNVDTYKLIYENLDFIFLNFNFESKFNSNDENFKIAYQYCLYARSKNLFKPTHLHFSSKIKSLIESVNFFKSKGINNLFTNGKVNEQKTMEIEKIIDNKFKNIGLEIIPTIFSMIPRLSNTKFYSFPTENKTQIYPWGYILNKAIKHTIPISLAPNVKENRIQSVFDYSKHYISLFQLQDYEFSQLQYIYSTPISILKLIDKHVIGDQLLKIEQYDPKSILDYLKFITIQYNFPEFNLALELAKLIISKPHNEIIDITFEANDIYKKYPTDVSVKISKLLTHSRINTSFHTIKDLDKSDYKNKPFIDINSKIFFLNHSFFYIGFYNAFLVLLYQFGADSKAQGLILEGFAEHSLNSTSMDFFANNNYKVNRNQRTLMGIKSENLEVDLLINNKKSIALFEIKHRVLTKESKGGNGYYILNDLSEALIKSQMQLNRHKRFLLNFNEIQFNNKQKISLDNKEIYKISVSSLDYQSLHNPLVTRNFLRSLPFYSLTLTDKPEIDKLVRNINEKIKVFSDEILKPETSNEIIDHMGLKNSYFINIFHFLFLIERASTKGTDFIDELTLYHNTILNQLDFYYCYFYKDKNFNN